MFGGIGYLNSSLGVNDVAECENTRNIYPLAVPIFLTKKNTGYNLKCLIILFFFYKNRKTKNFLYPSIKFNMIYRILYKENEVIPRN